MRGGDVRPGRAGGAPGRGEALARGGGNHRPAGGLEDEEPSLVVADPAGALQGDLGDHLGVGAVEDPLIHRHHLLEQRRVAPDLLQKLTPTQGRRRPESHGLGPHDLLLREGGRGEPARHQESDHVALEQQGQGRPRSEGRRPWQGTGALDLGFGDDRRASALSNLLEPRVGHRGPGLVLLGTAGGEDAKRFPGLPGGHRGVVELHDASQLGEDFLQGLLEPGRAMDGLEGSPQLLRVEASLALRLHGEGGAEEASLAGEGFAQGIGHLTANALVMTAQTAVHVAKQAVDVHAECSRRECTIGTAYNRSEETATARESILFVCTANRDRSPTAEELYSRDGRYKVRSAGVARFADVPLTRDMLLWADRVFVLNESEDRHRTQIRMRFPDVDRPIIDLDVEDRWRRGHPELVELLLRRLRPHLGSPMSAQNEAQCREEG